ncbi:MAG: AGE family epimerase/isomerase [Mucilaginibacter sp.]
MAGVMALTDKLQQYKAQLNTELSGIMAYWIKNTPDEVFGGFAGRIDENEQVVHGAPKGSVLNARILWSFAAAYNLRKTPEYLKYAERAYQYITDHFIDEEYDGVYWTVDYEGNPLDTKKQVYAIAFTIYGLSEYYIASGNENVKALAIRLYNLLVDKSFDSKDTGYFEAFNRKWQPIADLRLSEKDANEKKTMNTHLHVLEAYTNLYRIWQAAELKDQIVKLINNFLDHFIDPVTNHLLLFFDEEWHSKSTLVSYGHDIEAAWLLQEAAEVIADDALLEKIKSINLKIADATIKGLDADGGLWYEYEPEDGHLVKQKHWWPQAEAMVGFFNAWQISDDDKYLDISLKNWDFVQKNILDLKNGEWIWGIDEYGKPMPNEDKAGLWKCPYHNSRACIELIRRLS